MNRLTLVQANVASVEDAIARAAVRSGRKPKDVALVAVTKYVHAPLIRLLYDAGVTTLGESRVQALTAKRAELGDLEGVEWHLIGHLQRNKVARAVEQCSAIHSVDSLRVAEEILATSFRRELPVPDLYVEINVSRELQKTGLYEDELAAVLSLLAGDHRCTAYRETTPVRGLMAMAPYHEDPEESRPYFRRLAELRRHHIAAERLDPNAGLSMGMSRDFEIAIEEGATIVRIGSRLFEGIAEHAGSQ